MILLESWAGQALTSSMLVAIPVAMLAGLALFVLPAGGGQSCPQVIQRGAAADQRFARRLVGIHQNLMTAYLGLKGHSLFPFAPYFSCHMLSSLKFL